MSVAEQIRERLDARFRYEPDDGEDWRSLADAVRGGREWADDCDGYALTAAQIAVEDFDVPPENVMLAHCQTETGGHHLVCLVTEEGVCRAVDNRHRTAWDWRELDYTWHRAMRLSEKGVWRSMGDG